MGVVYKARHEKLKRTVALKMVSIHPRDDSQDLARFQAEAEAVARLHHPNIVQIFEVGDQDGLPYLALEFVTGGTLRNRLEGRPQPIRAAVQLVQQLARAAHAAHQRGIVHLDLKPANILLQPTPPSENWLDATAGAIEANQVYGVPKVSDFGVAKRIDDGDSPSRYAGLVGTPLYMAPEQAKGQAEEIGPAADIYSAGRHPLRDADGAPAVHLFIGHRRPEAAPLRSPGPAPPAQAGDPPRPGGDLPALPGERPSPALPDRRSCSPTTSAPSSKASRSGLDHRGPPRSCGSGPSRTRSPPRFC